MQPWVAKKGLKMSKIQLVQFTDKMQKYSIINDFYKCVNTRKFAQVTNTTRNSYRHHPLCGVDSVHVRILLTARVNNVVHGLSLATITGR